MSTPKLAIAMNYIDDDLVTGAIEYKRTKKKNSWMKWGAIAVCLCLVVVGAFVFQNGRLSNHEITLDNGDTLVFAKSDTIGSEQFEVKRTNAESHVLTSPEIDLLFNELPVSGVVYFDKESGQFVALEGKINDMLLAITAPGGIFADTVIDDKETISEIEGTAVSAGYFLTDENSKGERTIIYYASFKLGQYEVYVEHAGIESNSDTVKAELANAVQDLISNGELDMGLISVKPTE